MMPPSPWRSNVAGDQSVVDVSDFGAIPQDPSRHAEEANAAALSLALQSLRRWETLLIKDVYHTSGGIIAHNLTDVTIRLDGRLVFSSDVRRWPRDESTGRKRVLECIHLVNPTNVTLTSSLGKGADGGFLDGNGAAWWGVPFWGYVRHAEDRPRLLRVTNGTQILFENWMLLDPPYWAATFENVTELEARFVGIQARRTANEGHGLIDLSAFNTDGFDVSGRSVWIHDCNIWNQDDSIAVKGCPDCDQDDPAAASRDMLFERINASGMGLTIGSIGNHSTVRNITFRDSVLYKTYKGIYMKFRHSNLTFIENVLYENILMIEPYQWPIWVGPAQQADSRNLCHGNPCSICWPFVPGAQCHGQRYATYHNITLRNVTIQRPKMGAGVIMADPSFPIHGMRFDNVRVNPCDSETVLMVNETFPLLPSGIRRDAYVEGSQFLLFAVVLLLGTALIKKIASCASHSRWRARRTLKVASVAALVSFLVVPLTSWWVHLNLSMSRPDVYFVVEGVVGGVATGDTWPLPDGFKDLTSLGSTGFECGMFSLKPAAGAWLTAVALLVAAIGAVLVSWHVERRDPMDRYFIELPQMGTDEDGDLMPVRLAEEGNSVRNGGQKREHIQRDLIEHKKLASW